MIRLYDLKEGDVINARCTDDNGKLIGDQIVFHHLDGMYSYCTVKGTDKPVHLAGATPLKEEGDGTYSLTEEEDE